MRTIVIDYESFYDREYSLRRMTPVEYILDPRFECIGAAVWEDGKARWIDGVDLPAFFDALDPEDTVLVSYNALFDMCITAWRFNFVPRLMVDMLGVARALLAHKLQRLSLASVAMHLGLGVKGGAVHKVVGMGAAAIRASGLWTEYTEYACQDATLCGLMFQKLVRTGLFPAQELLVMDMVLRCAVQPGFLLDRHALAEHLAVTRAGKEALLARTGLTKEDLMSNEKFASALRSLGVEPPTKISPLTGKETYALAKADPDFIALEEHDDPDVQSLVAARLGVKSTLEEARTERLLKISNLAWPGNGGDAPWMPVPLRYSGAHTHRLSGDWRLNCMHPDVEVLTPGGWQRIEDWAPTTPIMQWWPDGTLSWELNARKVSRAGDSELVWFDSPFVKGGFTRDHRMVSLRDGRVVERTAGWIANHSGLDGLPVSGEYAGGQAALTPDQARLLVALAADGSVLYSSGPRNPTGRASLPTGGWQWGFHKQRKADRLRSLLSAANVPFNEWSDGRRTTFQVRERNTPAWLRKGFGAWLLGLSASALEAFLDELVHWDGFVNSRSGQPTFCTSQRDQALWVQTAAHLRGRPCTVKRYTKTTQFGVSDQWYVYFRQSRVTSVGNRHIVVKPYSGLTYCPAVSSSYVLVRYGEGVFVTGQCQNMPRKSPLRRALTVPPGHSVLVADASQIEARIVAWICGQNDLTEMFRRGIDVYSGFATDIYGYRCSKDTPNERFCGKTVILGGGYGVGWAKVQRTIFILSGKQIQLSDEEAMKLVYGYRNRYPRIPLTWRRLDTAINVLATGEGSFSIGPCVFEKGAILLPSGLRLYYHDLHKDEHGEWWFTHGGKPQKLYGGKLLENIVQALARIIVMDAAVRIQKQGLQLRLQAHDELAYIVRDDELEQAKALVLREMSLPPTWAPDLPLAAEAGAGPSYGSAK